MTGPQFTNYGLRGNTTASLDASGNGQSFIQNMNAGSLWLVRQVSVITSPEAAGATCTLTPPTGIIDTSYFAGTGDTAQGVYYLHSGDFIKLTWRNGPPNGQGIATYYYDEVIG